MKDAIALVHGAEHCHDSGFSESSGMQSDVKWGTNSVQSGGKLSMINVREASGDFGDKSEQDGTNSSSDGDQGILNWFLSIW